MTNLMLLVMHLVDVLCWQPSLYNSLLVFLLECCFYHSKMLNANQGKPSLRKDPNWGRCFPLFSITDLARKVISPRLLGSRGNSEKKWQTKPPAGLRKYELRSQIFPGSEVKQVRSPHQFTVNRYKKICKSATFSVADEQSWLQTQCLSSQNVLPLNAERSEESVQLHAARFFDA